MRVEGEKKREKRGEWEGKETDCILARNFTGILKNRHTSNSFKFFFKKMVA